MTERVNGKPTSDVLPALDAEAVAAERYDRQVRLWGASTQQALHSSVVIAVGLRAAASELVKNVSLAGVGRVSIFVLPPDHQPILDSDHQLCKAVGQSTPAVPPSRRRCDAYAEEVVSMTSLLRRCDEPAIAQGGQGDVCTPLVRQALQEMNHLVRIEEVTVPYHDDDDRGGGREARTEAIARQCESSPSVIVCLYNPSVVQLGAWAASVTAAWWRTAKGVTSSPPPTLPPATSSSASLPHTRQLTLASSMFMGPARCLGVVLPIHELAATAVSEESAQQLVVDSLNRLVEPSRVQRQPPPLQGALINWMARCSVAKQPVWHLPVSCQMTHQANSFRAGCSTSAPDDTTLSLPPHWTAAVCLRRLLDARSALGLHSDLFSDGEIHKLWAERCLTSNIVLDSVLGGVLCTQLIGRMAKPSLPAKPSAPARSDAAHCECNDLDADQEQVAEDEAAAGGPSAKGNSSGTIAEWFAVELDDRGMKCFVGRLTADSQ